MPLHPQYAVRKADTIIPYMNPYMNTSQRMSGPLPSREKVLSTNQQQGAPITHLCCIYTILSCLTKVSSSLFLRRSSTLLLKPCLQSTKVMQLKIKGLESDHWASCYATPHWSSYVCARNSFSHQKLSSSMKLKRWNLAFSSASCRSACSFSYRQRSERTAWDVQFKFHWAVLKNPRSFRTGRFIGILSSRLWW